MNEPLATGWGASEPIDDSVLRRFVFNQADVVRAMASGPAARHAADDDVVDRRQRRPGRLQQHGGAAAPGHRSRRRPCSTASTTFYADVDAGRAEAAPLGLAAARPVGPRLAASPATRCSWCAPPARSPRPPAMGVEVRDVTYRRRPAHARAHRHRGLPDRRGEGRPARRGVPDAAPRLADQPAHRVWSTANRRRRPPRSTPTASSTSASPPPSTPVDAAACGRPWCGRG